MTGAIKPRQIQALLLLLLLAPLIPTGLLVRFMFETVRQERDIAHQTISDAWQDTLSIAMKGVHGALADQSVETGESTQVAERIAQILDRSFEQEVKVQVVNVSGKKLAGDQDVSGPVVASAPVGESLPGTRVNLYLTSGSFVRDAVREQVDTYVVVAGLVIAANLLIAGVAGWAFLREIRREELRSDTLATLAHELRTPVASMRLLLDTIQEGRCPDQSEYLELMGRENERLSHLIDQFLTHSRLELGTQTFAARPVSPSEIANAAEETLRPRLQAADCTYRSECDATLPEILADPDSLVCALTNLLDNALKYTGVKKDISLRISSRDRGVEFAVQDNGQGIAAEESRTIFRRFYQVDNRLARTGEGCGLGLSIVKQIVERHRGRLTVNSSPGEGSCFAFWIPIR